MPPRAERQRGVTLLELLVVLAIVGLLAAFAYPSYMRYAIRARRAEAQAALQLAMQQQEAFYLRNNRYIAFSADAPEPQARRFPWWSGATAPTSAYELRADACEGQSLLVCVEIKALPGTRAVNPHFSDPDCGVLSLSSTGERTASGPAPRCWP
ncbi:MAG: type IV pilin protein [Pseudomonadota bacterium]